MRHGPQQCPRVRRMTLRIQPRRVVVAGHLEVETRILGRNCIAHKLFGAALLGHQGVAEARHGSIPARGAPRNGYRRSLTAAARRAPSALPAAITVAAFITWPICSTVGRSPISSATWAIAVSATSATSASVSGVGRYSSMTRASACSVAASSPRAVLGVDLGRFPALPRLLGQYLEHLVVGQLPGFLSGHLLIADRGEHHPKCRGAEPILGLHRRRQIRLEPSLQFRHTGRRYARGLVADCDAGGQDGRHDH